MLDQTMNAEYQRNVSDFVGREVFYCVSGLISHLCQTEPDSEYLFDICSQPTKDAEYEDEYDEALEHWIVSDWLAGKLESAGEMVSYDIHGLTVWGRQCSGQAISIDGVICGIYNRLHTNP